MDLRAEPIVVTMPKIEKERYYTGQLIDLYTFNFAYLGTRSYGNDGGNFLIAGPNWNGATPRRHQGCPPHPDPVRLPSHPYPTLQCG